MIDLEKEFEKYLISGEDIEEENDDTIVSKSDEYDPFSLIQRALSSDFDASIFDMIDDSDLPLANNWLEFCTGKHYLNLSPFPKQIKFGLELFADYCPDCSDPAIIRDLFDQSMQEILDRVQLLHHGKCPKCHKNRLEFVKEGKLTIYNELAGCAGQRGGKAQPLHSLIKVPNGWKRMGDMCVGDSVSVPDGGTASVTGVFPQGLRPTYRITFEDGRHTDCDENHLWKVFNEHWKRRCVRKKGGGYDYIKVDDPWKVKSLKEIIDKKSKYPLFIPLTCYKSNYKELPLDPYLLGLLLGDGNITQASVRFTNKDQEVLDNLKNKLEKGYYLQKEVKGNYGYRITHGKDGVSNVYKESLKSLNLWGKRSFEKNIPDIYKESSTEQRLELIRGLMDTDGYVCKKRGRNLNSVGTPSISTSSKQLALDIQYLVRSLGGICRITSKKPYYTHKGVKKQGKENFNCWIRHENPELFCKLSRKKENAFRIKNIKFRCKIKSIEYIGMQETQCITVDHPDHLYITDDFIVTHNSVWVAMTANYQLHRFLKLPNPSHYFKLIRNQVLHMVFVAITYKQAVDTLWEPFRSYYDSSTWFKEYNKMLDYYGEKIGKSLYENKITYILYDHKKLTAYAAGPDKRKLRGRTGFFCSIDELGWFYGNEKAIKLNPDEICKALERSLVTVRSAAGTKRSKFSDYNSPDALFVNISSPSSANDKIMQLVREKNIKTRYSFHLPTWEMNPTITRESLESSFIENPVAAERDFGANPPLSDAPYISNSDVIKVLIDINLRNKCSYDICYTLDTLGHNTAKVKNFKIKELDKSVNYVLGVDTGYSKNAFALVLQHYDFISKAAVIDLIVEIRPIEGSTVNFPSAFDQVIRPITQASPVALVAFDKWQSINYEQELHAEKIESERYSLKHEDFSSIRGLILSGKVIIPRPEIKFDEIINTSVDYHRLIENKPVTHFIYQILTVRDLGRMVTKGIGVDDDIFRAWCLGVKFIFDPKWESIFQLPSSGKKSKKALGLAINKTGNYNQFNSNVILGTMSNHLGSVQTRTSNMYIQKVSRKVSIK